MLTASLLAVLALKSVVLATVTLALLRLARSRTPAERSLIAHLGLLAILLLPLASLGLPRWAPLPQTAAPSIALPTIAPTIATAAVPVAAAAAPVAEPAFALPDPVQLAVWIYAIPLALTFALMALAVFRLFGMRRRADVLVDGAWLSALAGAQRRMGFKHGTALLVSDELRSPISWGVLRPTILLDPRAVSAVGEAEAIIAHELAHVARLDWAKLLIARLACAFFWFNPLVWLLARESHQLREEAADDTVLLTDIAGSDYATLLVNAARHDNRAVLIAAHGVAPARNSLRRRVVRVLDTNVRRRPVRRGWGALCLLAVVGVAAPLAAFSTVAPQKAPTEQIAKAVAARAVASATAAAPVAANETRKSLSAEDLVGMRAVGVTPDDVAAMRSRGEDFDPDDVIAAKATGVTADYVAQMRQVFPGAPNSELVGAGAVGVDMAFAQAMRAIDPSADIDAVIGAKAVGVTAAYAREIRAYFPRVELEDLVSMRAVGVTGAYIAKLRAAGIAADDPEDVVAMRAVGARRRGASVTLSDPPQAMVVSRAGATAVMVPGRLLSARRPDGTTATMILNNPPPPPPDDASDD
jgi:beta-lactamase regulating signal transducer with metallopeptidase domain